MTRHQALLCSCLEGANRRAEAFLRHKPALSQQAWRGLLSTNHGRDERETQRWPAFVTTARLVGEGRRGADGDATMGGKRRYWGKNSIHSHPLALNDKSFSSGFVFWLTREQYVPRLFFNPVWQYGSFNWRPLLIYIILFIVRYFNVHLNLLNLFNVHYFNFSLLIYIILFNVFNLVNLHFIILHYVNYCYICSHFVLFHIFIPFFIRSWFLLD